MGKHPPETAEEYAKLTPGRTMSVPIYHVDAFISDYLIEVESENIVREMKPDFTELRKIPVRGIIVTSRASSVEYDFLSRFFAPASGIDEDPATGWSHCCLGPYW